MFGLKIGEYREEKKIPKIVIFIPMRNTLSSIDLITYLSLFNSLNVDCFLFLFLFIYFLFVFVLIV